MGNIRLVPRLDIKGPNVIKGVRLEGLRVVGDPQEIATSYYEQGADEMIYIDVVASLYGRNHLTEIVRRTAKNIFVPLTVGGGIRSPDDAKTLLRAGDPRAFLLPIVRPRRTRVSEQVFSRIRMNSSYFCIFRMF